jgi:hypothetical protein
VATKTPKGFISFQRERHDRAREELDELVDAKKKLDAAFGQKPVSDTNPAAVEADHAVDIAWRAATRE